MPKKSPLETVSNSQTETLTLTDPKLINEYGGTYRSNANSRTFIDTQPNISIKSDYSNSDYYSYRSAERLPKDINAQIKLCMDVYDGIGIVYNVINLMSDFSACGIELVHPIKSQEKFWQKWFEKVNGKERSTAIVNMLYRAGNVVIQRVDGELPLKDAKDWARAGLVPKIPLKYVIHNPIGLQVFGGQLAGFLGKPYYMLKVASEIMNGINQLNANSGVLGKEKVAKLLSQIPANLKTAQKGNIGYIDLNQDELYPYFYKKDDGAVWAKPLVFPIMEDLMMLVKMKLADKSALDGVISNIRLWTLGVLTDNVATTILPTRTSINKLRNVIATNVGGGVFDLVWGPELSFKESDTKTHLFLGSEKYKAVWNHIYEGLGIPPTLTGTGGSGGGFTNNSIALKTLIDRLEYGRNVLLNFWNEQIRLVQKEMGFAKAPKVSFAQMSLSDEGTMKKLLIDLCDRNILSNEAVQKAFGYVPESQNAQIKRETKKRDKKVMPPKASNFHNPQTEEEMKKIILQGGGVAPSELGIELSPKKSGEKSQIEKQAKLNPKPQLTSFKPKQSNNGRPKNSNDTTKRKQKVVKRRAFIDNFMWAENAQSIISELLTPIITQSLGKKNVRQLTVEETNSLEVIKFSCLCALEPYCEINQEKLYSIIEEKVPSWASASFSELKQGFVEKNHREPSIEEVRQIQSSVYALEFENPIES